MPNLTQTLRRMQPPTTNTYAGRITRTISGVSYAQIQGQIMRLDAGAGDVGDRVLASQTPQGMVLISSTAGAFGIAEPEEVLIDL